MKKLLIHFGEASLPSALKDYYTVDIDLRETVILGSDSWTFRDIGPPANMKFDCSGYDEFYVWSREMDRLKDTAFIQFVRNNGIFSAVIPLNSIED
jgi:hypothetical protein